MVVTVPGCGPPVGGVTATFAPIETMACFTAGRLTVTTRAIEVASMTFWPGPMRVPRLASAWVTRAWSGTNSTSPRASAPVWVTPSC
jgi:hypothetical protein